MGEAMNEFCPWCGVTMHGDEETPARCSGRYACAQRKAFEDGQENGYTAFSAESRARAIRAVVAAQWGVACSVFCVAPFTSSMIAMAPVHGETTRLASLPCAVDLVDGVA